MKLTREAGGTANLSVRHHGRHDRSIFPFPGDTAISSGSCDLEFWMIRPDAKSAVVAYLQYDLDAVNRFDVGLYVPEGDASTIYFRDGGQNVASKATFPIGVWQRVLIRVDLEHRTYSAEIAAADVADVAAGSQDAQSICRDVKYNSKHNAFNMIEFSPQGATGSELFLRSEASYVQMVPTAETTNSDEVGFAIKNVATGSVLFELHTRSGTWHSGTEGMLTDSKLPAAFDAWNHLQLTLDSTSDLCQVLVQVIGEPPQPLVRATRIGMLPASTPLAIELFCDRQKPRDDGPAFDNLRLTRIVRDKN